MDKPEYDGALKSLVEMLGKMSVCMTKWLNSFKVLIDLILLCPCNMQYTNRTVCSLWSKYSPYGELNPFETRKHKGYLAIVAWGYLSNRTTFLETETMITAQMTGTIHN